MNTLQQNWEAFKNLAIPEGAPSVQVDAMQLAFYSGAESILRLQFAIQNVSDDAGIGMIEGWFDECRMFAEHLMKQNKE